MLRTQRHLIFSGFASGTIGRERERDREGTENIRKIKTEKWIRNDSEGKEYILSHQDTTFVEHYQERRHCQDHSQSFVNLTWASHLSIAFCFSLTNYVPFKETCQRLILEAGRIKSKTYSFLPHLFYCSLFPFFLLCPHLSMSFYLYNQ